jgi:hypothetical protein
MNLAWRSPTKSSSTSPNPCKQSRKACGDRSELFRLGREVGPFLFSLVFMCASLCTSKSCTVPVRRLHRFLHPAPVNLSSFSLCPACSPPQRRLQSKVPIRFRSDCVAGFPRHTDSASNRPRFPDPTSCPSSSSTSAVQRHDGLRHFFPIFLRLRSLSHQLSPQTPTRPRNRQPQHRHKYQAQPRRSRRNPASPLRQNRQSPINKFNMHPIHQQRSPPQLLHRTKPQRPPSPPAPYINKAQNHHDHSAPRQEKIRTRMPVVVRPIHSRPPEIER